MMRAISGRFLSLGLVALTTASLTAQQPTYGPQPTVRPVENPRTAQAPRPQNTRPQYDASQEAAGGGAPRQPIYRPPVQGQGPNGGPAQAGVVGQFNGPVGPGNGPAKIDPNAPLPCPFPTPSPEEQQLLDKVLAAWEQRSSQIERYRCDFERWEYDPLKRPDDPKQPWTYSTGKLRYAAPDKGSFKIETAKAWQIPAAPGEAGKFVDRAKELNEHWVCDGKRTFEFDNAAKKLIERALPPEMQGKAIVDGPLPFLFGAKADKIKARYWVRRVTPASVTGEFWMEAVPKYRADAMNFKMVHVIVDEQEFLPKALQLFDPSFDPQKRPMRSVFTFANREVNWNTTLETLNIFHREFYEPSAPFGWKKVIESYVDAPGPSAQPAAAASRPASPIPPFIKRK